MTSMNVTQEPIIVAQMPLAPTLWDLFRVLVIQDSLEMV